MKGAIMTPPKRILCDAPEKTWWPIFCEYMIVGAVGVAIGGMMYFLTGCTDSKASGPVHVLEIGDPVLVRSEFPTVAACEEFTNRLIVVLHKAKSPIPEPMRCN
jgi:hypothetical protein